MVGRTSEIDLQLEQVALGIVQVHISVRDGTVGAHLRADSLVSKDLIGAGLQGLREGLAGQGLGVGSVGVSLGQSTSGRSYDRSQSHPRFGSETRESVGIPVTPATGGADWLLDRIV